MKLVSILAALALCVVASAEPAAVANNNEKVENGNLRRRAQYGTPCQNCR